MPDWTTIFTDHWRSLVEVLMLWFIVYNTYLYFRATRGARIFTALVVVYLGLTLVSSWLDLVVIGWLLKYISVFLAIALVIIFQPELRRALAQLGSHRFFSSITENSRARFTEMLIETLQSLSKKRTGALIAIQRNITLEQYMDSGTNIDARISRELMETIFYSGTILHDGGMVIRATDETILSAGCVFPLTQKELSDQSIGLRHRAAMGVTEESDAIVLVVSEETGAISLVTSGKLERNLKQEELEERLIDLLKGRKDEDEDLSPPIE